MADTDPVGFYYDQTNSSSRVFMNQTGSHCWEPDGSFHSVCIFVIGVSIVCGIVTVISVYRIVQMVMAAIREPENIHETLKMYKLQPLAGSSTTMSRNCTAENLNSIETVETVTCRMGEEERETSRGRADCLC